METALNLIVPMVAVATTVKLLAPDADAATQVPPKKQRIAELKEKQRAAAAETKELEEQQRLAANCQAKLEAEVANVTAEHKTLLAKEAELKALLAKEAKLKAELKAKSSGAKRTCSDTSDTNGLAGKKQKREAPSVETVLNDAEKEKLQLRYTQHDGEVKWRICTTLDLKCKYAVVTDGHIQPVRKITGKEVRNPLKTWQSCPLTRSKLEQWCTLTGIGITTVCTAWEIVTKSRRKKAEEAHIQMLQTEIHSYVQTGIFLTLFYDKSTIDDVEKIEETLSAYRNKPTLRSDIGLTRFKNALNPQQMEKKEQQVFDARQSVLDILQIMENLKDKLKKERAKRAEQRKKEANRKREDAKQLMKMSSPPETYTGKPPPLKTAVPDVPMTYEDRVLTQWKKRGDKREELKRKGGWKTKGL